MSESLNLKFTAHHLEQLLHGEFAILDFLTVLFNGDAGNNYLQMCTALKAYHHQNGGAPEVLAFEVGSAAFNKASLSGSFSCKFKISFFSGAMICTSTNTIPLRGNIISIVLPTQFT